MKLVNVADVCEKSLECKKYHKGHFLLISVLEAPWLVLIEKKTAS